MIVKPLHDLVLVEPSETVTKTATGLVIPDTAAERPNTGTVIAVGPGRYDNGTFVETRLAANNRVLFSKGIGNKVKVDGKEMLLIREQDIIAVIEE